MVLKKNGDINKKNLHINNINNPTSINNICPANILANNRIAKLKGRIKKEKNSIIKIIKNKLLGIFSGSIIL